MLKAGSRKFTKCHGLKEGGPIDWFTGFGGMSFAWVTPWVCGCVAISCGRAGVSMNLLPDAGIISLGDRIGHCVRKRGGGNHVIQRLDTDDASPGFNESLVPGGLTAGAPAYADFGFTYGTLPSYLQAADYIKMVNADQYDFNYQLQLNLNQRSNVYLLIDDRYAGVTQWETGLGFVDTGDNILLGDQTTSIYRTTFDKRPGSAAGSVGDRRGPFTCTRSRRDHPRVTSRSPRAPRSGRR